MTIFYVILFHVFYAIIVMRCSFVNHIISGVVYQKSFVSDFKTGEMKIKPF